VERTPAETGHLEEREDRLDRHLGGDLPADDPAPRGVDRETSAIASVVWTEVRSETLTACGRSA